MTEWAILKAGEIINVMLLNDADGRERAEKAAQRLGPGFEVAPLESLPRETQERYRYWNERP